jgi:hypothetical protein
LPGQLTFCGSAAADTEVPSLKQKAASLAKYDHRSAIDNHKSLFSWSLSANLLQCAS